MQRVIKLALKAPFEVGMVEVARMKIEVIRMNRNRCVFELDDDFHALALGASRKIQQRMFVQAKLGDYAVETAIRSFGHARILV